MVLVCNPRLLSCVCTGIGGVFDTAEHIVAPATGEVQLRWSTFTISDMFSSMEDAVWMYEADLTATLGRVYQDKAKPFTAPASGPDTVECVSRVSGHVSPGTLQSYSQFATSPRTVSPAGEAFVSPRQIVRSPMKDMRPRADPVEAANTSGDGAVKVFDEHGDFVTTAAAPVLELPPDRRLTIIEPGQSSMSRYSSLSSIPGMVAVGTPYKPWAVVFIKQLNDWLVIDTAGVVRVLARSYDCACTCTVFGVLLQRESALLCVHAAMTADSLATSATVRAQVTVTV